MTDLTFLDPSDSRWQTFLKQRPTAMIFHHPAWMQLLHASYGYRPFVAALTDGNDRLLAGIPFAEVNTFLTPRRWVALPFSDFCYPLYDGQDASDQLINCLVELHRAGRCPQLEIRAALPSPSGFQSQSFYVQHAIQLDSDLTRVAKGITRQQMQNIRKAEKNGIRVVQSMSLDDVRAFYRLHCLNRRRHGVPVQPWAFFQRLHRELLEPGLGFVMLAYDRETCISGGIFLHWQKTLTYKYSATDEAHQDLRPNHLVNWTAIQWGCERGYTLFDFGRSDIPDEGLREFKRRWGAVESPLYYSYLPSIPSQHTQSRLAGVLKTVISHTPVWVCQAAGDLLYRFAG